MVSHPLLGEAAVPFTALQWALWCHCKNNSGQNPGMLVLKTASATGRRADSRNAVAVG